MVHAASMDAASIKVMNTTNPPASSRPQANPTTTTASIGMTIAEAAPRTTIAERRFISGAFQPMPKTAHVRDDPNVGIDDFITGAAGAPHLICVGRANYRKEVFDLWRGLARFGTLNQRSQSIGSTESTDTTMVRHFETPGSSVCTTCSPPRLSIHSKSPVALSFTS